MHIPSRLSLNSPVVVRRGCLAPWPSPVFGSGETGFSQKRPQIPYILQYFVLSAHALPHFAIVCHISTCVATFCNIHNITTCVILLDRCCFFSYISCLFFSFFLFKHISLLSCVCIYIYIYIPTQVDHGGNCGSSCDGPVCPDPVWNLNPSVRDEQR